MRLSALYTALFLLVALALATSPIQPSEADIERARHAAPPTRRAAVPQKHKRMTNARRLQQGLPLLRPRSIPGVGTPTVKLQARAVPSPSSAPSGTPPPPSFRGVIKVTNKANGQFIGFVSKDFILTGELGSVTTLHDAMTVDIAGLRTGLNGPLDIVNSDPEAPFPFVGPITGFASSDDTLATGSSNYKYIGGVLQSPAFSTPDMQFNAFSSETGIAETTESAVWFVNTITGEVTAQWINADGHAAPSILGLYQPDNVFVLQGDSTAFAKAFGAAIPVTFTLFALPSP